MSTNSLPPSYTVIYNTLELHTVHSVIVYTSTDRVNFNAHPSPIYGCSINDLSSVLSEVQTKFAIQVSNVYTRLVIDSAPYPQGEVDLGSGLGVRIVEDARDLIHLPHYEAVFIRTDGSLVIWGDDEDATLHFWVEVICRLQNQPGAAIPASSPLAGLPGNHGINPEDTIFWRDTSLTSLDEFYYLLTFADNLPPSWGADDPQGYEAPTSSWQRMASAEPSEGSLGFVLPQRLRSPFSEATTTSSSLVNSPSTADLEGIFPSYAPSVYFGEEDEVASNMSFNFAIGDRGESPLHSVVETSAPGPFAHGIIQKATREDEEDGQDRVPQPIINLNGSTSGASTGNADVDLPSAPNTRVLKRSHSVIGTGSAPARLTAPLPDVESVQPEEDKRRKFLAIVPAPSPTAAEASTPSTPTSAPAPTFPSPPASISTPASGRKPPRRPGNRRRGGGSKSAGKNPRGKRHPCPYCNKTFSRLQDQQRHSATACDASPHRSTVDCPECGSILSRLDAAQRHWRGHENPTCPTPEWVSGRS